MLQQELSRRIGEDGQVVSSRFTVSEGDGLLYVAFHAECLEKVGEPVPLTEEEIYSINAKIPKTEDTDT